MKRYTLYELDSPSDNKPRVNSSFTEILSPHFKVALYGEQILLRHPEKRYVIFYRAKGW